MVVLVVLMLLAVALFLGGVARQVSLLLGSGPRMASSVGAMSALGLFVVFLLGFLLREVTAGPGD